jgi:hypothetical protein
MDIKTHQLNKAAFEVAITGIIGQRTGSPREYAPDPRHQKPKYVVRMCERLAALCRDMGAPWVQLEDVLKKDSLASGHSDYVSKLALYCAELLLPNEGAGASRSAA